jgi:hypothetical protein
MIKLRKKYNLSLYPLKLPPFIWMAHQTTTTWTLASQTTKTFEKNAFFGEIFS